MPGPVAFDHVRGQDSFLLRSDTVSLAITRTGGMMGPVTFFPGERTPISPYAIAPWAEERLPDALPPMLAALRGDWFCSAFGENRMPWNGRTLPPHGETANGTWRLLDSGRQGKAQWLRLGIEMPAQGGRCDGLTALVDGQSVVYQRHDMSGLTGPVNPGHHATLAFPDTPGSGRLSFSPTILARTLFEPLERPENRGYSALRPDTRIDDLGAVPCVETGIEGGMAGGLTDLTLFPARRGYEDIAILCADPALPFAWSAVTFAAQRYVWFALRDPRKLASTLLWFSNGGRHFPPWNGRHVNVMGIEDVTAYFHVGAEASCLCNPLRARGIRTCLEPDAEGRLSIPYVQGVARIPEGFDEVVAIEAAGRGHIALASRSGMAVTLGCDSEFLNTGQLAGVELP